MNASGGVQDALARFSPATRAWFADAFEKPTEAQAGAWDAISGGSHALVIAPTGSGKTLAAFLWALDGLLTEPQPEKHERCRVVYVSPLKALASDVERNLRSPLVGIRHAAARAGRSLPEVRVGTRTGDTPAGERRTFAASPPDILITTPESLYLVLTSSAREGLRGVRTVIVDEVHAVAGSKRGGHLALSLERLDALLAAPAQRIGLSATVRPAETVAHFLGGNRPPEDGGRPVVTVRPQVTKEIQLDVVVPVPDLSDLASTAPPGAPLPRSTIDDDVPEPGRPRRDSSIWPHVEEAVTELIRTHRSTIVFANSRRGAERLTARINECWADRLASEADQDRARALDPGASWAASYPGQGGSATARPVGQDLARAHHGSMSREERTAIESALKAGTLPAVVATSSLELGIDMGSVDLVVQVGAPPSVSSALQRLGRAGHQVGAVSRGVALPTHRGDLLATAVVAVRAAQGAIEEVHVPGNPLDVLAQQIVAMVSVEDWNRSDLAKIVRRAAPFGTLGDRSLDAVLDMLSGRYPSEDFAELRPRIVWERLTDVLSARPGAQRLAVTSGGTIPDRGSYGVYLVGGQTGGRRVGELDEEMVYESRVGDTFTLGSSTWRIEDITPDRVLVSPAPGLPGRLPFWRGDAPGRPAELGRALGQMVRELTAVPDAFAEGSPARSRLADWGLDPWAVDNLLAYLREQQQAVGHLADDRTIVVERFRDELGDWRLVVHSPWGARVHGAWALVIAARLRERFGVEAQAMHADDGIVLRLPDVGEADLSNISGSGGPSAGTGSEPGERITAADLLLEPEEVAGAVVDGLAGSAHFAARFREAAARSLLLPRRRPDRRQPLWQQRQRSAQLLSIAAGYPDFPVVLEAVRECLQDDFDVPALADLMRAVAARRVRILDVTTGAPSPAARSLLFGYVNQFLYDGDSPLAERRAAALTLDPALLGELLGAGLADVADLLDEQAIAEVEAEVGLRSHASRVHDVEGAADLVRRLGPVTVEDIAARAEDPSGAEAWLARLVADRRIIEVRVGGERQWAAVEDAGRLRDALGTALPPGLPAAVTEPVADPLGDLLRRHARTHGPFTVVDVASRFALGPAVATTVMRELERRGLLVSGRLRPGGSGQTEFCDPDVLRRIRRRSLARLRAEVEPVPQAALGIFLPRWQSAGSLRAAPSADEPGLRGVDGVLSLVDQLAGARIPASALETLVLPVRVQDYEPALLDELLASGEVKWVGAGGLPGNDGFVALAPAEVAGLLSTPTADDAELPSPLHGRLLSGLRAGGAYFFSDLMTMATEHERVEHEEPAASPTPHPSARAVADALWDLVWAGLATNDSLGPLRARLAGGKVRHAVRRRPPRSRGLRSEAWRVAAGLRTTTLDLVPPDAAGRWSAAPTPRADPAVRVAALAAALLERNGILTRGAAAELPGGFQAVYPVLSRLEEAGHVRRGYFIEGLGAAQFALPSSVDRLRSDARDHPGAILLAAADPANPYGAALPWPERPAAADAGSGHRPGRTAGSCVVLVDGALVLYLERGGRSILSFVEDAAVLAHACQELAHAVSAGLLGRLVLERADGAPVLAQRGSLVVALSQAGFIATPRGFRLRHGAA